MKNGASENKQLHKFLRSAQEMKHPLLPLLCILADAGETIISEFDVKWSDLHFLDDGYQTLKKWNEKIAIQ